MEIAVHESDRPHAPATERNREPILAVLRTHFADRRRVLEIGSGTGQHALYFAAALPQLQWQCSDRAENLPGIQSWLDLAALPNLPAAIELDVGGRWPSSRFDAVFTANTLHIMSWPEVEALFAQLPAVLEPEACLLVYGPFNYAGAYTSQSNAQFDAALRLADPRRGIRDVADVDELASRHGLELTADLAMPANNRCRLWRYSGTA